MVEEFVIFRKVMGAVKDTGRGTCLAGTLFAVSLHVHHGFKDII